MKRTAPLLAPEIKKNNLSDSNNEVILSVPPHPPPPTPHHLPIPLVPPAPRRPQEIDIDRIIPKRPPPPPPRLLKAEIDLLPKRSVPPLPSMPPLPPSLMLPSAVNIRPTQERLSTGLLSFNIIKQILDGVISERDFEEIKMEEMFSRLPQNVYVHDNDWLDAFSILEIKSFFLPFKSNEEFYGTEINRLKSEIGEFFC